MKLEIEKYLRKNRWKLDADTPDDELIWDGIQQKMNRQHNQPNNRFWKIAAVFLLGILATYVVVKETTEDKIVVVTLSDISKDLGEQEAELKLTVAKKWKEIEPLTAAEKSEFKFLFDEMNELDKVYKIYEQELYNNGENEQIIHALLDYYEKKIRLLNRLSLEIEKQKNYENITL